MPAVLHLRDLLEGVAASTRGRATFLMACSACGTAFVTAGGGEERHDADTYHEERIVAELRRLTSRLREDDLHVVACGLIQLGRRGARDQTAYAKVANQTSKVEARRALGPRIEHCAHLHIFVRGQGKRLEMSQS